MNRNLNRRIHPIAEADGLSPKKPRKDGQFIREWDSATSFGKHIGKDVSGNIIACIKGKQPTAYGFKWEYKYDKN